jgi:hypothetical protein
MAGEALDLFHPLVRRWLAGLLRAGLEKTAPFGARFRERPSKPSTEAAPSPLPTRTICGEWDSSTTIAE